MKKILFIALTFYAHIHAVTPTQISLVKSATTFKELQVISKLPSATIKSLENVNQSDFIQHYGTPLAQAYAFMKEPQLAQTLKNLLDPAFFDVTTEKGAADFLNAFADVAAQEGPINLIDKNRLTTATQNAQHATKNQSTVQAFDKALRDVVAQHNTFANMIKKIITKLVSYRDYAHTNTLSLIPENDHTNPSIFALNPLVPVTGTPTSKNYFTYFKLFSISYDHITDPANPTLKDNQDYPCVVEVPTGPASRIKVADVMQKQDIAKTISYILELMINAFNKNATEFKGIRDTLGITETDLPIAFFGGAAFSAGNGHVKNDTPVFNGKELYVYPKTI